MAEAALASAFGFSDVDTFRASRDPSDAGRGTTIDDAPGPVHVPGQSDSSGAMDEWEEEMLSRESAADEDVEAYVAVRLQQQAEVWPSHLALHNPGNTLYCTWTSSVGVEHSQLTLDSCSAVP